jgi:hypothetical protein
MMSNRQKSPFRIDATNRVSGIAAKRRGAAPAQAVVVELTKLRASLMPDKRIKNYCCFNKLVILPRRGHIKLGQVPCPSLPHLAYYLCAATILIGT